MAVDTSHAEYDRYIDRWQKIRHVIEGEEAVHAAGEAYLPKLSRQTTEEYNQYKKRALFLNATQRTVDGLSGMVFRKAPDIRHPEGINPFLEDVDQTGLDFQSFAETVVEEVLSVGRYGALVEWPETDAESRPRNAAEARALNVRPSLGCYKAEDIFNWRMSQVNNRAMLTQVRLLEKVEEETGEFEVGEQPQIRVLELVEGQYRQRLFRQDVNKEWREWDTIVPLRNGQPLTHIPFYFFGPRENSWRVMKPPLLDLVNTNLAHYRVSAGYFHGLHYTALPTLAGTGITQEDIDNGNVGFIGPTGMLASNNADARFYMVEYQGSGLSSVGEELGRLEQNMASLGARMLLDERRKMETAETAQIHRTGEHSVLASLAASLSHALQDVLQDVAEWMGVGGEITVDLNRDYFPAAVDHNKLEALFKAWQGGGISRRTYFWNLKQGEIIPEDRSYEDELAEIQTENPFGALSALSD